MNTKSSAWMRETSPDFISVQDTGDLVHIMLCNFDAAERYRSERSQNEVYRIACEELNRRLRYDA